MNESNNNKNKNSTDNKKKAVLDTSALLALFSDHAGGQIIYSLLGEACISILTYAEVLNTMIKEGGNPTVIVSAFQQLKLTMIDFDASQAEKMISLLAAPELCSLSLCDAAAITLAQTLSIPLYTAIAGWRKLKLPVELKYIGPI
jgi:PIN domain nuclease of toxin-antitoxin system